MTRLNRIYCPLLGEIELSPLIKRIMLLPEVQRLRQVPLSNVDSCSLLAIGGVSRFEHSIGTAVLASRLGDLLRLDQQFAAELVLAAALHDVAAPGLGHLFEEGCRMAGIPFDHESRLREIVLAEGDIYFQAYLGRELGLRKLLADLDVSCKSVFDAILGKGRCGAAVKGAMDLDNIDNVARMLWRLGQWVDKNTLFTFLSFFGLSGGLVVTRPDRYDVFEEWLSLRRRLYDILMLEPSDFAAKSMTKLAVSQGLACRGIKVDDWVLTDMGLLHRLLDCECTKVVAQRLLLGDYYRVINMHWVEGEESVQALVDEKKRALLVRQLRECAGEDKFFDFIPDKRERIISGPSGSRSALVGIISEARQACRREQEVCDDFIRQHFATSRRVFPEQENTLFCLYTQ